MADFVHLAPNSFPHTQNRPDSTGEMARPRFLHRTKLSLEGDMKS